MLYGAEYESGKIGSLTPFESPQPEPLRCGSCGARVFELNPCTWDTTLAVGPCCETHPDDFALTSPSEMPRLEPIRIRPVRPAEVA